MTHVYHRDIEHETSSSLHIVTRWITSQPGPVLDVGMGTGSLARLLTKVVGAELPLDGITFNPDEAAAAAGLYRDILVLDLESADLTEHLQGRLYRWIVCADVLEHLREPERVLGQLRPLLAADGELVLSIPNVGYVGLVAELLQGRWRYRDEGLLDRTHLRFFTRESLHDWLRSLDWRVVEEQSVTLPVGGSEFRPAWEVLPERLLRHLLRLPDAETYQFVLRCSSATFQGEQEESPRPAAVPVRSVRLGFAVELFLDDGEGFRESFKVREIAELGRFGQTVVLPVPALQDQERRYQRLRLDPSDRTGLITLVRMQLHVDEDDETPAWSWSAEEAGAVQRLEDWLRGTVLDVSPAMLTAQVILLVGDDAQIEIPLADEHGHHLARKGGRLTVTLGAAGSLEGWVLAQRPQKAGRQEWEWKRAMSELDRLRNEVTRLQETVRSRELALHTMRQAWHVLDRARGSPPVSPGERPVAPPRSQAQPATLPGPPPEPVLIVVPVYRGLEDTRRCLRSVLEAEVQTPWRLLVIDDCSPEPALQRWLDTFVAEQDPQRVRLIRHEENLGFVRSVNEGMALASGSDVVLLNSDTEVTDGWLDRLRAACHRDAAIGTATPWSNHATIFSYPCWPEGGRLPPGWTAGQMAELCGRWLVGQTIEVPTAHGFCMYVKAACLAATGPFDAEAFGQGYGEENDFCLRASALGWRHVHALDAYVYHRGSVSFGSERDDRVQRAIGVIRQRYPGYESEIQRLVQRDPWERPRRILDLARLLPDDRVRVLLISHDGSGGTERHQYELAAALGQHASFVRLQPHPGGVAWYVMSGPGAPPLRWHYRLPAEYRELITDLRALDIQLVHFHHWQGLPASILGIAADLGVPYDVTVHDHYAYCPQIHLSQTGIDYCGEPGPAQCQQCLQRHPAPDGGRDIQAWRVRHAALLAGARHVIAPCRDVASRIWRHFGVLPRIAAHDTLTRGEGQPWPEPQPLAPSSPASPRRLRVVVLGALGPIKGADLLEATASLATREGAPVEFHLVGYAYRSLRTFPRTALVCHGPYEEEELPRLLAWLQPDLVWLPSRVPETYSYTLSAALAAALPVAATDLGALAERLDGRPWSWLLPVSADARAWLDLFVSIHDRYLDGQSREAPVARSSLVRDAMPSLATLDYQRDYLPAAAPTQADPVELGEAWMKAGRQARPAGGQVRLWLLGSLVRLRSTPLLRGVAARIPAPVQRRIKRWLLR